MKTEFMEKDKYIQDIEHIKNMMEKSSRFISLSGLSGVAAGIFALIAAWQAWDILYDRENYFARDLILFLPYSTIFHLVLVGLGALAGSLISGYVFTRKRAKAQGRAIWDESAKRLTVSLAIPLVSGGVFLLILLSKGLVGIVAPGTLIFYGLALINASKYSLTDIRYLGISEIIVGLFATYYIGYGLVFWAFGFGILHIVYGIIMYLKYERQP